MLTAVSTAWKSCLISSCFFSSRLKIRISPISVYKNLFSTALPNEPVPPVINRVFPVNTPILNMYLINYFCPFTYQPFGYLAQFRLVVWLNFVWLFDASNPHPHALIAARLCSLVPKVSRKRIASTLQSPK